MGIQNLEDSSPVLVFKQVFSAKQGTSMRYDWLEEQRGPDLYFSVSLSFQAFRHPPLAVTAPISGTLGAAGAHSADGDTDGWSMRLSQPPALRQCQLTDSTSRSLAALSLLPPAAELRTCPASRLSPCGDHGPPRPPLVGRLPNDWDSLGNINRKTGETRSSGENKALGGAKLCHLEAV